MGGTLPNFLRGEKTKILQWHQWAIFVFSLILRNPPLEIGEIVGIYVAWMDLTDRRLSFWKTLYGKLGYFGASFDRLLDGNFHADLATPVTQSL